MVHEVLLSEDPSYQRFHAARLKADLEARGISVWNEDPEDIQRTPSQEDIVRQAIRDARLVLVVASPNTRSSRAVKERLRIAAMYKRRLVIVWAEDDERTAAFPHQQMNIPVIDAREMHYEEALDEIVAYLEEEAQPATTHLESAISEALVEPRKPYKGLRAFTREDTADFFGRDTLMQELTETLQEALTAEKPGRSGTRWLTAIGPSGSGKSSVVLAGLLPSLQRGSLTDSEEWVYLEPIVPGKRPLESLVLTLASCLRERSLTSIREDLEDDSARGLHLLATQLFKRSGTKVVLTVDQFEELFAQSLPEDERQHFIDLLVIAATEPGGPVVVLSTLRADFYDRPLSYPDLGLLIQNSHRVVLPMTIQDLRAGQ